MVTGAQMQEFLTRSRLLVLLLNAAESWALTPCPGSRPYKILGTIAEAPLPSQESPRHTQSHRQNF